jgi:hypothetical protein
MRPISGAENAARSSFLRLGRNEYLSRMLELFDGCTVGYGELIEPEETQWARVLAEMTRVSEEKILECRNKRVRAESARKDRAEPILEKSLRTRAWNSSTTP